ncbi:hypothetical protein ACG97_05665 [Vogesella sp. EB]|uniref:GNAT family N-acetyltransferase n=1 Tax=Vogesella sp. EB TaxID=1526735 RepID=UPI00064D2DB5|nr:GNAT family N-acetyltransferase [Vogesella sp. EB]KMJ54006.1 hypothetical protein ACG97_05665 [Vogesella sp. EB]
MKQPYSLRRYQPADSTALRDIFHAAVHQRAARHYSAAQCAAWAPATYDPAVWQQHLQARQPWLLCDGKHIVGFADLQADGLIDLFFVHPAQGGQGAGTQLMQHLLHEARRLQLPALHAHVSLAAEAFFLRHGFSVQQRNIVTVRGQQLENCLMEKRLP